VRKANLSHYGMKGIDFQRFNGFKIHKNIFIFILDVAIAQRKFDIVNVNQNKFWSFQTLEKVWQ